MGGAGGRTCLRFVPGANLSLSLSAVTVAAAVVTVVRLDADAASVGLATLLEETPKFRNAPRCFAHAASPVPRMLHIPLVL